MAERKRKDGVGNMGRPRRITHVPNSDQTLSAEHSNGSFREESELLSKLIQQGLYVVISPVNFPILHSVDPDLLVLHRMDAISARISILRRQISYSPSIGTEVQGELEFLGGEISHSARQLKPKKGEFKRSLLPVGNGDSDLTFYIKHGVYEVIDESNFPFLSGLTPEAVGLFVIQAINNRITLFRELLGENGKIGFRSEGDKSFSEIITIRIKELEKMRNSVLMKDVTTSPKSSTTNA